MAEIQDKSPTQTQKPRFRVIYPDQIKKYLEAREKSERDKKLWILLNRAWTRKEVTWLKNIVQDTTDEKYKKLNENRENFQNKYWKYNSQICERLKMDNNLSVSVIERESGFDEKAKSPTWADSYMQLTNDPFDDMKIGGKWRWKSYIDFFKNIPDSIISQIKNPDKKSDKSTNIKIRLSKLKSDLNNPNLSENKIKSSLNKTITFLNENRKKPEINLLIWNIYLESLRNEATDEKIDTEINKLSRIISGDDFISKAAVGRFKYLLEGKWIVIENEEKAKMVLNDLQKDLKDKSKTELRKNFYALSRYNWAADKIIYAATISVAQKVKNDKGVA